MTRALVVYCHPSAGSFVEAVRNSALAGLDRAGAEVRVEDLYADGFDPAFSEEEWRRHLEPGADPAVTPYAHDLAWADTLVLVYPTWWSGQPAMLKGWIDRVWVSGVAWDLPEGANKLRPRLDNIRRIVAVTTHGSSKLVNSLEGEGGKRTVTRSLRSMCHRRARTSWLALYGVDSSTPDERAAFLTRVEDRLAALAR
ncbi:MAG: NAD(P)H-dependent oxidoreductase [Ilumatobacteraceae bacterium]